MKENFTAANLLKQKKQKEQTVQFLSAKAERLKKENQRLAYQKKLLEKKEWRQKVFTAGLLFDKTGILDSYDKKEILYILLKYKESQKNK